MASDPKPQQSIFDFNGKSSMGSTDSYGTILSDFFEMKRAIIGIGLEQVETLVGQILHLHGQATITTPEVRGCEVPQSSLVLPA